MSSLHPADLAAIDADHRMLFSILQEARNLSLPCGHSHDCRNGCLHESECQQLTRETFHRVLFATIGHFGRQEQLIRPHIPGELFERHVESHADISEAINRAIARFAKTGSALAAFDDLRAIEQMYDTHYQHFDTEVHALLVRPKAVAPRPPVPHRLPELPLTGDPQSDQEHRELYQLLQRSRAICLALEPGCDACSEAQRSKCTAEVIDLITDALKFMVDHFRHEEQMIQACLPTGRERDLHLSDHAELSRHLSQLVADYEDSNTALCIHRLSETLHAWVKHHISHFDVPLLQAYARHVEATAAARDNAFA